MKRPRFYARTKPLCHLCVVQLLERVGGNEQWKCCHGANWLLTTEVSQLNATHGFKIMIIRLKIDHNFDVSFLIRLSRNMLIFFVQGPLIT